MKRIKKFLKILGIVIGLLLVLLITLPFLFQDKIKQAVLDQVNENLNAEVYLADVGLSFIKNFPDASVSITDFGVVGKGPFEGDTLVQGKRFELIADLMTVISGNSIKIKGVALDQPKLKVLVLEDSTANYDIALPDTATAAVDTAAEESLEFLINLQSYRITDGSLYYEDKTMPLRASLHALNHSGKGDFTATNYDLKTQTSAKDITVVFDNVAYLKRANIDADVNMNIDVAKDLTIKLLENIIRLNELSTAVDGAIAMPGDDISLDLAFDLKETNFRDLLSLVPGIYTADFKDIKTEGFLAMKGFVKGVYNETSMPGFGLDLEVRNGKIQYPDLPEPISNIGIDLHVNEPDGTFDAFEMNLKRLHAELGKNPIDGKLTLKGLGPMNLDGALVADVNLEELSRMVPMEGTELRGRFQVNGTAKGIYDDAKGTFPTAEAVMSLSDGYVKNSEYPTEITDLNVQASLKDASADLAAAVFEVPAFSFKLDGEPLAGSAIVKDFSDPAYDVQANGTLDLDKLMKVYPIDSMELSGKILVENFRTQGRMSDIEAERYTALPTSGKVQVDNLRYLDYELGNPVTVDKGTASFTPERLEISGASGMLGTSDYQVSGFIDNYLKYALLENEPLSGTLQFTSKKLDLNEWMEEEIPPAVQEQMEEVPLEAFPIPKGIDMDIVGSVDEVIYDTYNLKKVSGKVEIADEAMVMKDVGFNLLGSQMKMGGSYDTKVPYEPAYSFFMDLRDLNIGKAAQAFSTLQTFAPITQLIDGAANTTFAISGKLKKNLDPILESINSEGAFEVLKGSLQESKSFGLLADLTKIDKLKSLDIGGAKGWFTIQDGYLEVTPIELSIGDIQLSIGGKQNLSGNLDYDILMDIPAGKTGQAAFSALSNLTGTSLKTDDRVAIDLKLGGTFKEPKLQNVRSNTADQVKNDLITAGADKLNDALKDKTGVDVDVPLNKDSLKQTVDVAKQQAQDSLKAVADRAKKRAEDSVKAVIAAQKLEAQKKLEAELEKNLGSGAKNALDSLKTKFKIPKFGKKKKN